MNQATENLKNQQIVERLKKRIMELPKQFRWSEKHRDYQTWLELQKILGEEK